MEPETYAMFWMVWQAGGNAPTYKHGMESSAEREAERLARENPGTAFYVLQSVSGALVEVPLPPPVKKLKAEDIPF